MRAGRLRHRVSIQSVTKVRTDSGGYTETWTTDRTAWASIEPMSGREFFLSQQVQAEVTHKIQIRYPGTFTVKHRVKFGVRVFNPVAVTNPQERNVSYEIMAKEEV